MEQRKPVKGQMVEYHYGYNSHFGKVIAVFDDFYVVKGYMIGKQRVSFDGIGNDRKINPVYKDGNPVMKRSWFNLQFD